MENENRILVDKETSEITIKAFYDGQKQMMLNSWLALWSIAGLAIVSQFFFAMEDGLMIYLIVWMAFWVYFEYKAIYAYRWRKFGSEIISFDEEFMNIENRIANRGIPQRFEKSWIKNIRLVEKDQTSFWQALNVEYWNIGQEGLIFELKGRDYYFGRDLTKQESQRLIKLISNQLKS